MGYRFPPDPPQYTRETPPVACRLVYYYAEVKRTCDRRIVRRRIIRRCIINWRWCIDHRGRRSVIYVRPWIICGPVKEVGIKIRAVIVPVSAVLVVVSVVIVAVSMVIVLIVPAVIVSMVIVLIVPAPVASHARSRHNQHKSNDY